MSHLVGASTWVELGRGLHMIELVLKLLSCRWRTLNSLVLLLLQIVLLKIISTRRACGEEGVIMIELLKWIFSLLGQWSLALT